MSRISKPNSKKLFLGSNPIRVATVDVEGQQVVLEGEQFYRISNSDQLRPFFLSIVSSADHWMFISSNGGLTSGRRNPDLALFPYYTDDKIRDGAEFTGPKTILIVERGGKDFLWEPFSERGRSSYRVRRNLYKNLRGNKIAFEEINDDLGLTFRYSWSSSAQFGWVRKASLESSSAGTIKVRLLDGLQNLLPTGISSQFQLEKSTLVDAYKKNELLPESGLGLFLLSSVPVDRPEPAESLRATTVWSAGIPRHRVLLSSVQLERFRRNQPLQTETDLRAERGAYFIEAKFALRSGQSRQWMIVADVDQGPSQVAQLRRLLRAPAQLQKKLELDVARGTDELWRMVAKADGLQKSGRSLGDARHFSNVLFNIMRGGIFCDGYEIDVADLRAFVHQANKGAAARHASFFRKLGKTAPRSEVLSLARGSADADLERLCLEYLPLSFSRRHGDPSRPWNRFSIAAVGQDGRRTLNYEGNWRDIFQNWEALSLSFPGFVGGMVGKFVNASTADGYNPYRITRDGIDWEVHDPNDPWSHIGYWGDHQIIYLLKLLEIQDRHEPVALRDALTREIFSFANVPYRIKAFSDLVKNPRETVDFDATLDQLTRNRVRQVGSDGKLIWDKRGRVVCVNLTEKLLVSLLAKFANFVPGAGIWLNTQRPEWNDANNALVGDGVSMVTLYQMRRFIAFCADVFESTDLAEVKLSDEVAKWFSAVAGILDRFQRITVGDAQRRQILDALGGAASDYRAQLYAKGLSGRKGVVKKKQLLDFFHDALVFTDKSIRSNKRKDGLYHSYNLVEFGGRSIPIRRLYAMLEGQTAVLSSNLLSSKESLEVLTALRRSPIYRANQHTYMLYPDRPLPRFLEKNNIPEGAVSRSRLLKQLLSDGNRLLIERDVLGICHFNPHIKNAADLQRTLQRLAENGYGNLVRRDSKLVLALFEKMFDHRSFTGRSGAFFGYEGLGCIFWHMVSKLRLAAQESFLGASDGSATQLAACYHDIRAGIGDFKTPENFGAFPMDPYSHTPAHTGARQPGLTGQVKEDILCRFGELGVHVRAGRLCFEPKLLRPEEFVSSPVSFDYCDVFGRVRKIQLSAGSLAFTYCQVPVIYRFSHKQLLTIELSDGQKRSEAALELDEALSRSIFERRGLIRSITCDLSSNSNRHLRIS